MHRAVILKNIPSVNKKLLEVKHLLKIQPLSLPHGLPEHESDFENTVLQCDGKFIVKKVLKEFEPAVSDGEENPTSAKWDLSKETVKKVVMRKKELHKLHTEYHPSYYKYRLNQDGKEYRYTHNKDLPKYRF